ncbi:MAG TPA: hypothetical protein VFU47_14790 [Armatimonadota bacterium]|nr:hypothetical protein [Armatimonadota bacterium]
MFKNFVRYTCLLALVGLAVWAGISMPPEASALNRDPMVRRYGFAPVGLIHGQTLRVSIARPDLPKPAAAPVASGQREVGVTPDLPDQAHLALYDARGVLISELESNLPNAGETFVWEVRREDIPAKGALPSGQLQVRPEALITPNHGSGRFLSPVDMLSMELVDTATGKTMQRDTSVRLLEGKLEQP